MSKERRTKTSTPMVRRAQIRAKLAGEGRYSDGIEGMDGMEGRKRAKRDCGDGAGSVGFSTSAGWIGVYNERKEGRRMEERVAPREERNLDRIRGRW
jgi:hypothetical protein